MKIAVMQPYLFPYIGYFQLIQAVDCFIFFDDVNYIKKGWINKNNLLINNQPFKFSVPIKNVSQNKLINEVELLDFDVWKIKFLKTLEMGYKKAPFYNEVMTVLNRIFSLQFTKISELAAFSVIEISNYLHLTTKFERASDLNYLRNSSTGQEKILSICNLVNAHTYINPTNGRDLYDKKKFSEQTIELFFIALKPFSYSQFDAKNFVPFLSIIDVLMFNDVSTVTTYLKNYDLE